MSDENNSQNTQNSEAATMSEATHEAADDTKLQEIQQAAEKYKNDFLYLRAEFENYKRNTIKERSDILKYSGEKFIRDFLEVMDNFDRALESEVNSENFENFKKGVQMISSELKNLLEKHSVKEVPAQGQPFDPLVHEALGSEPTNQVEPGFIARVFKKPYKLHDKLIRIGQVIVAKKPE